MARIGKDFFRVISRVLGQIMSDVNSLWNGRLERLRSLCGGVHLAGSVAESTGCFVGVTSSRLGLDPRLHYRVGRFLQRSLFNCMQRRAELLVANGSAIEPWAIRAAELFGVPYRRLCFDAGDAHAAAPSDEVHPPALRVVDSSDSHASVDAALIALSDRVDAVFVRRGGLIARQLRTRLKLENAAGVRVAVTRTKKCDARGLIQAGAIGWFDPQIESWDEVGANSTKPMQRLTAEDPLDPLWSGSEGQWLIHCTRAPRGRWPGETQRQYVDSILLGDSSCARRGAFETLVRIVRCGRLLAAARTSNHRFPVVCFSSLPLKQLLEMRCFRQHLGRWDYEPYGVAIRIDAARRIGIQPVIYGNASDRLELAEDDRFRFHPRGERCDWTQEREWRSRGSVDLLALDPQDVRIFAIDDSKARSSLASCPWRLTLLRSFDGPPCTRPLGVRGY